MHNTLAGDLFYYDISEGGVAVDDIVSDSVVRDGSEVAAGAFYLYSLGVAVVQIGLFLVREEDVAIAGTGDIDSGHAGFGAALEPEVFIQ